jgi:hypothetical protein
MGIAKRNILGKEIEGAHAGVPLHIKAFFLL